MCVCVCVCVFVYLYWYVLTSLAVTRMSCSSNFDGF